MATRAKPIALAPEQEAELERLLSRLTLTDKLGQMFQIDWRAFQSGGGGNLCVQLIRCLRGGAPPLSEHDGAVLAAVTATSLGSVLGGGGAHPIPNTPEAWCRQMAGLQRAAAKSSAGVSLLIGSDTVHGQVNLRDATLFPHHIAQGCMRDAEGAPDAALVAELASLAARESYACGVNWLFTPCVAVAQDLRWGRAYESFSEDPALVAALGAAEVRGVQEESGVPVAACLKHWLGDGGTAFGTGSKRFGWTGAPVGVLDQGDTQCTDAELRSEHLAAYGGGLLAGSYTVMVSYSAVNGAPCVTTGGRTGGRINPLPLG